MNVMKKAWEFAKEGAKKFGGKAKDYFVESLKLAWKEIKNMSEKIFDASAISLAGSKGKTAIVGVPTELGLRVIDYFNDVLEPAQTVVRKENGVEYHIYTITTDGRYGSFSTAGDGFWRTFKVDLKNRTIYYNGGTAQ